MHGQQRQLLLQCHAVCLGLPRGGLHRNDHVAQQERLTGQGGGKRRSGVFLLLREGKNVGGLGIATIASVQVLDSGIVSEQYANFRVIQSFRLEQTAGCLAQSGRPHRTTLPIQQRDDHTGPQVPQLGWRGMRSRA